MLQMSPAEPSESRRKGRAKPKCSDWRLEPTRFSSWTCLVWLQAKVWRVIYNVRSPKVRIKGKDAEEEIISQAKLEAFPEEYMVLLAGKEIRPWLDDFNSLYVFHTMLGFP